MRDVSIIGIGQLPVGEHWEKSLRLLGAEAVLAALADAHVERPEALYVGNMLCGQLSNQQNLAALVAFLRLVGIERPTAEGGQLLSFALEANSRGEVVVNGKDLTPLLNNSASPVRGLNR